MTQQSEQTYERYYTDYEGCHYVCRDCGGLVGLGIVNKDRHDQFHLSLQIAASQAHSADMMWRPIG